MSTFQQTAIKIPSATASWQLDAWKYLPASDSGKPVPVIVMAHGLSANKLLGLKPYAETFASIGYACVVFDYRHWGASDGTPRNVVNIKGQLEDYRTVIKYARQQHELDAQRVIVFGTSFSGGHAIKLAAERELNISATIAQCPFTGSLPPLSPNLSLLKLILYAHLDAAKQLVGLSPIYIPSVAAPGEVALLALEGAVDGMQGLEPQPGAFLNKVNASSIFQILFYKPSSTASKINAPMIIIAPEDDDTCDLKGAKNVITEMNNARGELVIVPGGHYGVYPGSENHQQSLDVQVAFLKKHVPV